MRHWDYIVAVLIGFCLGLLLGQRIGFAGAKMVQDDFAGVGTNIVEYLYESVRTNTPQIWKDYH